MNNVIASSSDIHRIPRNDRHCERPRAAEKRGNLILLQNYYQLTFLLTYKLCLFRIKRIRRRQLKLPDFLFNPVQNGVFPDKLGNGFDIMVKDFVIFQEFH